MMSKSQVKACVCNLRRSYEDVKEHIPYIKVSFNDQASIYYPSLTGVHIVQGFHPNQVVSWEYFKKGE
jgi:hypothetical protein